MKHFEPIVIQEETFYRDEVKLEKPFPNSGDFIELVIKSDGSLRIGISHQAATRLRDALNSILND